MTKSLIESLVEDTAKQKPKKITKRNIDLSKIKDVKDVTSSEEASNLLHQGWTLLDYEYNKQASKPHYQFLLGLVDN